MQHLTMNKLPSPALVPDEVYHYLKMTAKYNLSALVSNAFAIICVFHTSYIRCIDREAMRVDDCRKVYVAGIARCVGEIPGTDSACTAPCSSGGLTNPRECNIPLMPEWSEGHQKGCSFGRCE